MNTKHNLNLFIVLAGGITVFLACTFVLWTLVPYLQMLHYGAAVHRAERSKNPDTIVDAGFSFAPYTYIQPELRDNMLTIITDAPQNVSQGHALALKQSIARLETVVQKDPHYPQYYLSLGRAYTLLAKSAEAPQSTGYLAQAEGYYTAALALEPGNPEIVYAHSLNLINQKRPEAGVSLINAAIARDPEITESYYYRALAHYAVGPSEYVLALGDFEYMLAAGKNINADMTKNAYTNLFANFYAKKDIPDFLIAIQRLAVLDPDRAGTYAAILQYINARHELPNIKIDTL